MNITTNCINNCNQDKCLSCDYFTGVYIINNTISCSSSYSECFNANIDELESPISTANLIKNLILAQMILSIFTMILTPCHLHYPTAIIEAILSAVVLYYLTNEGFGLAGYYEVLLESGCFSIQTIIILSEIYATTQTLSVISVISLIVELIEPFDCVYDLREDENRFTKINWLSILLAVFACVLSIFEYTTFAVPLVDQLEIFTNILIYKTDIPVLNGARFDAPLQTCIEKLSGANEVYPPQLYVVGNSSSDKLYIENLKSIFDQNYVNTNKNNKCNSNNYINDITVDDYNLVYMNSHPPISNSFGTVKICNNLFVDLEENFYNNLSNDELYVTLNDYNGYSCHYNLFFKLECLEDNDFTIILCKISTIDIYGTTLYALEFNCDTLGLGTCVKESSIYDTVFCIKTDCYIKFYHYNYKIYKLENINKVSGEFSLTFVNEFSNSIKFIGNNFVYDDYDKTIYKFDSNNVEKIIQLQFGDENEISYTYSVSSKIPYEFTDIFQIDCDTIGILYFYYLPDEEFSSFIVTYDISLDRFTKISRILDDLISRHSTFYTNFLIYSWYVDDKYSIGMFDGTMNNLYIASHGNSITKQSLFYIYGILIISYYF